VFVGVMTAQKYLESRAVAVYETWGNSLPGRVAFFSSEVSSVPEKRPDLPLIRLRGVDDSYPPQKKSFKMLQYMWENYGEPIDLVLFKKYRDFLFGFRAQKYFIKQVGRSLFFCFWSR